MIWGAELVGDIGADNTAQIFGEKVYCLGADNVKHVNRLRGASVKYCYGDEVVTWNPDVFSMLKSRLDKAYSRCDLTCNPEGPTHWFKRELDKAGEDWYIQTYTLDDNPKLDEAVKKRMKRDFSGTVFYQRYISVSYTHLKNFISPLDILPGIWYNNLCQEGGTK